MSIPQTCPHFLRILWLALVLCLMGCNDLNPPPFAQNLSTIPGARIYKDFRTSGFHTYSIDGTELNQQNLRGYLPVLFPNRLLIFPVDFPNQNYYFAFDKDFVLKSDAVVKTLHIKLTDDMRTMTVPVLKRLTGTVSAAWQPSAFTHPEMDVRNETDEHIDLGKSRRVYTYHFTGYSMEDLALWVSKHQVGGPLPVINETGIAGRFDFDLAKTEIIQVIPRLSFCGPMVLVDAKLNLAENDLEVVQLPRPMAATFVSLQNEPSQP